MLRNGAASLHGSTNVQKVCRIHEGRGHLSRRQLTSRAFNARVHSSLYNKYGADPPRLRRRAQAPRPPGPGQGHPKTTRDPLRPLKRHPKATPDHVGRPKSRQESPWSRQEGSKRTQEAPGGPPEAPKSRSIDLVDVSELREGGHNR